MEFDPNDQDIIGLVTKLKDIPGEYPENLLMVRRQVFLKRIAEIELSNNGGTGSGNSAGHIKPPIVSPTTGTLLETALIAAIVVETSAMAYFYRDKVRDFIQTFKVNPRVRVEEVTPAPVLPTSWEIEGVSPSPAVVSTATLISPASVTAASATLMDVTATPTNTPIPEMADKNRTPASGVSSTPDLKGNNGHHYGQTPKPARTKENSGKNDKPPKNKDDKPPKDKGDQPPKDDKPPKDKDNNPPAGNNDKPPEDKPPKNK